METLSDITQKANKEHLCDWCNQPIFKGEIYEKAVIKTDYLYTWKNHIRCRLIATALKMFENCDMCDGVTSYIFEITIEEEFRTLNTIESLNKEISFKNKLDFVCNHFLKEREEKTI